MKLVNLIAAATLGNARAMVVRPVERGLEIAMLSSAVGEASFQQEISTCGSFMSLFIEIAIAEQSLKALGWVARTDLATDTIVLRRCLAAGRADVEHRLAA